jgi:uncharacterized membrane protein
MHAAIFRTATAFPIVKRVDLMSELDMEKHEWLLKRNCSLTPRQLAFAYALLCFLALVTSAPFVVRGAWVVLAYAALELLFAAAAFVHYARHATDQEHIALADGCLLVERTEAGEKRQIRLDPYWTRIATPRHERELIWLEARGVHIAIGRFVTEARRREFALELRHELQGQGWSRGRSVLRE